MKRIGIYSLFILVFTVICYGSSMAESFIDKSETIIPGDELLNSIEKGTLDAEAFTVAVERRHFILKEISPKVKPDLNGKIVFL